MSNSINRALQSFKDLSETVYAEMQTARDQLAALNKEIENAHLVRVQLDQVIETHNEKSRELHELMQKVAAMQEEWGYLNGEVTTLRRRLKEATTAAA